MVCPKHLLSFWKSGIGTGKAEAALRDQLPAKPWWECPTASQADTQAYPLLAHAAERDARVCDSPGRQVLEA